MEAKEASKEITELFNTFMVESAKILTKVEYKSRDDYTRINKVFNACFITFFREASGKEFVFHLLADLTKDWSNFLYEVEGLEDKTLQRYLDVKEGRDNGV